MKKAIFLDRDGTVIVNHPYQYNPALIEYFSFTQKALRIMQDKGYDLFIITNQSGVARGFFDEKCVPYYHDVMNQKLIEWGLKPFADLRYCPHGPDDKCKCRKPKSQMIDELVEKYDIDISQSYMIGDRASDAECGRNAGLKGIILTKEASEYDNFETLLGFAKSLPE